MISNEDRLELAAFFMRLSEEARKNAEKAGCTASGYANYRYLSGSADSYRNVSRFLEHWPGSKECINHISRAIKEV